MASLVVAAWDVFDDVVAQARRPSSARDHAAAVGTATRWWSTSSTPSRRTPASSGSTSRSSDPTCARDIVAAIRGRSNDTAWPVRYAARRIAWHVLDHAWEIEDRREPVIRAGGAVPARLVQAVTVIVPVIEGWTLQWNANVPASVNVNSNVPPPSIDPESNDPSSAVNVCGALSSLRTTTVVPTGTVRSSLNANPEITISAPAPAASPPPAASVAGVVASLSDGA